MAFARAWSADFLLRLRFGQLLRGGRGLSLRRLLALLCLSQGGLGLVGRFALGSGFVGGLLLLRVRLGGILGNLLGLGLGGLGGLLGCLPKPWWRRPPGS